MSWPARKLPIRMVEKVWGRENLPAPFVAPDGQRIGEIWFEPPPELPQVLVKYLFTSEKLSVQVHPSDANALGGEDGKEECWLVLDAKPGARLAIGFNEHLEPDEIEAAARDGSIEGKLAWYEARAGDVFFLPSGTVHAIGPGLALVEVQQNSDTTFRLYDYGRPRALHLERALAVIDPSPYCPRNRGCAECRGETLIAADHFRLDRVVGEPSARLRALYAAPLLALPLEGELRARSSDERAVAGECLIAPDIADIDFSLARRTLLTRPA